MTAAWTPSATYRLQFHAGFTFDDAALQVDYLRRLGISDIYASPILRAREGSRHGYDVVDPDSVNPALGGEDGLRRLMRRLRTAGMGLIVDIVPNHMAVGAENALWWDVLEKGMRSVYAEFFDIDWTPSDLGLTGKLLLPILGAPYREVLQSGHISLAVAPGTDRVIVAYGDHRLPLRPDDSAALLRNADDLSALARDQAALDALLARQHYRLAWWRTAGDRINWRRFFDINELIAVQMEHADVFDMVHATILRLYAEGLIDGLRVDHIDGLTDPAGYCRRLRERLASLAAQRPAGARPGPAYLVVEKILAAGEELPQDWGTDGTTGYEFMNETSALLHDPAGERPLTRLWEDISERPGEFEAEECLARGETLERGFAGQYAAVARAFHLAAQGERPFLDLSEESCRRALGVLLKNFSVYRTYATRAGCGPADAGPVASARARARPRLRPLDHPALDFICDLLLRPAYHDAAQADAAIAFQKLSAPLAAKAVEDTAFYRYGRLLSRNDVGFDVGRFAVDTPAFHDFCRRRAARQPHALSATATHDHKRGEDVRARLAILSEIPELWEKAVSDWSAMNAPLRPSVLAPADEYQLYQTVVGAWPLALTATDAPGLQAFAERLRSWQEKALREAKLRSSWADSDAAYEAAAREFIDRLFDPAGGMAFLAAAQRFVTRIAAAGALNGLTQTLLRCLCPGTPDLYQGCEYWDFSLVDPDNRQEVDYAGRAGSLGTVDPLGALAQWRDGMLKQTVIAAALNGRRRLAPLFSGGVHEPLQVSGPRADSLIAFVRRQDDSAIMAVLPRFCAKDLMDKPIPLPSAAFWDETFVRLPEYLAGQEAECLFQIKSVRILSGILQASELFSAFPASAYLFRRKT